MSNGRRARHSHRRSRLFEVAVGQDLETNQEIAFLNDGGAGVRQFAEFMLPYGRAAFGLTGHPSRIADPSCGMRLCGEPK